MGTNTTYSTLHPILNGENPNNAISEVTYEMGF